VDFALYRVDLTRDLRFNHNSDEDQGSAEEGSWMQKIPLGGKPQVKAWSKALESADPYKPFSEMVRVECQLPAGAYLLEAKSGSLSAREILLVSDATLVIKSSVRQALVYFADALTGAPLPNANVAVWESYYENN